MALTPILKKKVRIIIESMEIALKYFALYYDYCVLPLWLKMDIALVTSVAKTFLLSRFIIKSKTMEKYYIILFQIEKLNLRHDYNTNLSHSSNLNRIIYLRFIKC